MIFQCRYSVLTTSFALYYELRVESVGFCHGVKEDEKQKIIILIKNCYGLCYHLTLNGLSEILDTLKSKSYDGLNPKEDDDLKFRMVIDAGMEQMWMHKILPQLRKWKLGYRSKLSQTKGKRTMHCIFGIHDLNEIILTYLFL